MTIIREERIGGQRLIQGDCLEVMRELSEFDAGKEDEVHGRTAGREHQSEEVCGDILGSAATRDYEAVREWLQVSIGNGENVQGLSNGIPESNQANGHPGERAGSSRGVERSIHRRDAIDGLSENGCEGKVQPVRGNGSASYSSHRPQPHEQHAEEPRSAVQPLSQQSSQTGMVGRQKGWAILTDPPYGIGIASNPVRQKHSKKDWDAFAATNEHISAMLQISQEQIIWGGNYFSLPPSRAFLVWNKKQPENFSLAMCEQAWWSKDTNAKIFTKSVLSYDKQHPTQKPVELMEWCLGFLPNATTILDPFMGSGTTLVACQKLGRQGTGIELDPDYFDIACKRVDEAVRQPDLFVDAPAPAPKQEGFDL